MKLYLCFFLFLFTYLQYTNAQVISLKDLVQNETSEDYCELEEWYVNFNKIRKGKSKNDLINVLTTKIDRLSSNNCPQSEVLDSLKGMLHYRLGNAYRDVLYNDLAYKDWDKARELFESRSINDGFLAIIYRKLGDIKRLKKDFQLAEEYYHTAEKICLENNYKIKLFNVYLEMFTNYLKWNRPSDTLTINELYLKAKAIPNIPEEKRLRIETNRALIYLNIENYKKALNIYIDSEVRYQKLLEMYTLEKSENKIKQLQTDLAKTLLNIAKLQTKLIQFDKANEKFEEVEKLFKQDKVYKNDKNFYPDYLIAKTTYYEKQNQHETALEQIQQILQFINPLFTYETIYQNPNPDQIFGNPYLLTTLADKAEVFKKMYIQTGDKTNLAHALDCYELSYTVADQMRKEYSFKDANIYMSGYTYSYFEQAIELCQTLAKVIPEKQDEYQQKAFEIAQRSSMKTLFWEQNNKFANNLLPPATKAKLDNLIKEISNIKIRQIDEPLNETLKSQLFNKKQTLDQIDKQLEDTDDYYAYNKFRNFFIDKTTLQNTLSSNEALLNYFAGDSLIYCFVFTKSTFQTIEIENPELITEKVVDFRKKIEENKSTKDLGFQLYQQLLEKVLVKLPSKINRLTIIPDGILNALPFEALQKTIEEHDYLIHDYAINYDLHSYFLSHRTDNSSIKQPSAVGFGVEDFSNWEPHNFDNLSYSTDEVENIVNQISGNTFPAATKQQFLQHFYKYPIVHISTHASADTLNASNSCIYFSRNNENQSDDMLTRDEILNYQCNAEMIVLSACETGFGKHNRGEGIASLARAFRTIGSKSEVMTLWKIQDLSASIIMKNFYKHLKKGKLKSEALRQAKLGYITSDTIDNFQKYPYYWAGFLLQGNPNSIY